MLAIAWDIAVVRMIFTDEAGTSAVEPVCVVAAVIVEADSELRSIQQELSRAILDGVPACYRENFIFHATEIFSGGKIIDRNVWSFDERLDFLKSIVCLPFVHDLPISLGKVFKGDYYHTLGEMVSSRITNELSKIEDEPKRRAMFQKFRSMKFDGNSMAHLHAFQLAIERADFFLREDLGGTEVGTIYAEDCPNMQQTLRTSGLMYRWPWAQSPVPQRPSETEQKSEMWSYKVYRIDHIVEQPCFVGKRESPLLQLADACAFSFRRYFSGKEHGEDLVYAMLGQQQARIITMDDRWQSGASSGLFRMKDRTAERPSRGN